MRACLSTPPLVSWCADARAEAHPASKPSSLPRELLLEQLIRRPRVHLRSVRLHELSHGLAKLLFGEAVFRQELLHQLLRVPGRGFFGQILPDDFDLLLELLGLRGFAVFLEFFLALDQLLGIRRNRFFRRLLAQVRGLGVGEDHPNHPQPLLLPRFHGRFHVFLKPRHQIHRSLL
jgi:hypothetical protein